MDPAALVEAGAWTIILGVPPSEAPVPGRENVEISALRRQLEEVRARLVALTGTSELTDAQEGPLASITDAFLAMDGAWRFTYLNEEAERILGRPREGLIGKVAWEEFPEAAGSVFQQQYELAVRERRTVHFEEFFPPLDTWFHIRAYPCLDGVAVCFHDVTAVKRMEAFRIQQGALLERVAEGAPVAEVMAQAVKLIEAQHPAAMGSVLLVADDGKHLKLGAAPRIPAEYNAAVDGIGLSAEVGSCGAAISGKRTVVVEDIAASPLWNGFHDLAARNGLRACWSVPILSSSGAAIGSFGVYHATPRAPGQGELELVQSCARVVAIALDRDRLHERVREQAALMDETREAIIVRDLEHRIIFWNKGAERVYGWSAAEALGHSAGELLYKDPARYLEVFGLLLKRGEWDGEIEQRRKDGSTFTAECHWTLVMGGHGRPRSMLAVNSDITHRLELEHRLRQSQRLEVVGQLTGGVAHDFNNLLTVILGNSDLLSEGLKDRPKLKRLADMNRTAAENGAELTKRLLAFARKQALQPKTIDLNQLVGGMHAMLRRTLGETVEIEYDRGAGLWPAVADPSQLDSAVLNLCVNARDAMPKGGRLTLETANASLDQAYADGHAEVEPGQYVMVAVSDTGSGIPPEHLARVFEPFFTTKEAGKGTGLGLSMVYGFVKQSKGHISIYSEVGQGTTVRMYLPRSHQGAEPPPPPDPPMSDFAGTEKILLVEDDALVRQMAEEQLQGLGYQVVSAANGPEAMEVLKHAADIALLFTDVVMPGGMTGRQLAEAALAIRPDLKVLYTSGYTGNAIVHHGRLDPGVHLLNKPYRQIDLARKLREALGKGS